MCQRCPLIHHSVSSATIPIILSCLDGCTALGHWGEVVPCFYELRKNGLNAPDLKVLKVNVYDRSVNALFEKKKKSHK